MVSPPDEPVPAPPTIAVVVPTYNERANIAAIVEGLRRALRGERWELLFVDDDSPDRTLDEVERHAALDGRVRRVRRVNRRGLASACIEGAMASTAPFIVLMDGDAQHDPELLPRMLGIARDGGFDVVVAARDDSAGFEDFRSPVRKRMTRLGNAVGRFLARGMTRDPLSGFFLMRRAVFDQRVKRMYGHGFKVLLDLLSASAEPLRVTEVPTRLRPRVAGESKMSFAIALDYALLVAYRLGGGLLSPRFALYCAVGFSGIAVNLAVLQFAYATVGQYVPAQAAATFVAMTTNYFLNNLITFRDRMLRGRALWAGLLTFYGACTLGAVVGVAVGQWVHSFGAQVWVAGLAAALASAVWNFAVNDAMTWRDR